MYAPHEIPKVISVPEAATMLGVSRPTMYDLTEREDFNALVRIGKRKLILMHRFTDWLNSQADKGG